MKTERELFEEWAYSKKWNTARVCNMGLDHYVDDFVDGAWHGWQASASRDGYKLVPIEPTEEMLDASRRRQWDDLSSPYEDMDMLKYKAMIGAYKNE